MARTALKRNAAGHDLGTVDLEPTVFGLEPNRALLHQVVTAQLAAARAGHPVDQDPGRGARRRGQAVPPEGHRPGPPGLQPLALDERRWRGPRAEAPQLRASAPRRRWSAWPCSRRCPTGPRRGRSPWSTLGIEEPETKDAAAVALKAARLDGKVLVVLADDEVGRGALVRQPPRRLPITTPPSSRPTTSSATTGRLLRRAPCRRSPSDFSGTHSERRSTEARPSPPPRRRPKAAKAPAEAGRGHRGGDRRRRQAGSRPSADEGARGGRGRGRRPSCRRPTRTATDAATERAEAPATTGGQTTRRATTDA